MASFLLGLSVALIVAAAAGPQAAAQPPPAADAPPAVRAPTASEGAQANRDWEAADAASASGEFARAEALYRKVLVALESTWGPANPRTAALLEGLGAAVSAQGRYAEAEAIYRRIFDIHRTSFGDRDLTTAASAVDLATSLQTLARYEEAERLLRGALAVVEAARGEHRVDIAAVLNNLAANLDEQGRYADGEPLLRRALELRRAALGDRHRDVGAGYANLANNLIAQGRFAEAEQVNHQGLEIRRAVLGENHPETAASYSGLAASLNGQNRYADAEPFFRKALEIRRATLGEQHPSTGSSSGNLAVNLSDQGRHAEAEPLYRQALEAQRAALGEAHPRTGESFGNLAVNLSNQGRHPEAEALFRQSVTSLEASLGPAHPGVAAGYNNLAISLDFQRRFAEAEPVYRKALDLRRAALGEQHPATAQSLTSLARALGEQERFAEAERLAAGAVGTIRALRARDAGARLGDGPREAAGGAARRSFEVYLDVASRLSEAAGADRRRLGEQAFTVAQDFNISAAGQALAQAAARVAAGQAGLGDAVRRRQDLAVKVAADDARLLEALAAGDADTAKGMRAELERAGAELQRLDAEIRAKFPRYAELVSPDAMALVEVQRRLRPDEGLLLIVPAGDDVQLFAVSQKAVSWERMEGGAEPVAAAVSKLRCQADPATCDGANVAPTDGDSLPFDRGYAHGLYLGVVQPVEAALKGVKTLYVTATGPLSGLPLGLLLTEPPPKGDTRDLRDLPWLADRYALVTLPSVSTLRALGGLRVQPGGPALAAFGDPLLGAAKAGASRSGRGLQAFRGGVAGGVALADPEVLRRGLDPLPGTRAELTAMAQALQAPASALHLGADATETTVKNSPDLTKARVVIFATHGLLPNELRGLDEPGLVFTPPATASALDDGLLTASEAARLNLAADWVILSACNTAAADGTPGGEALSGLAKAFLYAGAHALLASHWRVADDVTSALTVQTLAAERANPKLGKAQALQQAMRAVRTGVLPDGRPLPGWNNDWAHPAGWAPFVLVSGGE